MKQSIHSGLILVVAVVLCTGVALAAAHDETKPAAKPAEGMPQMSPEMQAEMEAWMKLHAPGKEHEMLAQGAGSWKAAGKSYMGPEPMLWEGTSTRAMILDGRVLAEDFSADMMGMKFSGHGMTGYDNAKKQWWSTWNDSMSTGVMVSTGKWDDEAKGLVFDGTFTGPDGKDMKVRLISRHPSATTEEFEYWEERGGKMTKTMEMTLTKQ